MMTNTTGNSNSTSQTKKVKEPHRKELTQCQYCYKSRLSEGVSLSKCAGCKTALYCSKECQKAGWPLHKETCKINQRQFDMRPTQAESLKVLRAFTAKHRPSIANWGLLAFDLTLDPTRGLRDILVILLEPRHGATRPEMAYTVADAYLRSVDSFGEQAEQLRGQMKFFSEENIRAGLVNGVTIMLWDIQSGVSNIAPVGFGKDTMSMQPGLPWKEELARNLNNGIVL